MRQSRKKGGKNKSHSSHASTSRNKLEPSKSEGKKEKKQGNIPGEEERLVQAVEHIDDHIPVGGNVHNRTGKLLRDRDHLYPFKHTNTPYNSKNKNLRNPKNHIQEKRTLSSAQNQYKPIRSRIHLDIQTKLHQIERVQG